MAASRHTGKHDSAAESCPIWLSDKADDNGNNAGFLFFLDGQAPDDLPPAERIFIIFDGTDEDVVSKARTQWQHFDGAGHTLVTGNRMTPVNGHGHGDCCLGGASGLVIHRRRIYKAISARMILAVTCLHKGKFNGS